MRVWEVYSIKPGKLEYSLNYMSKQAYEVFTMYPDPMRPGCTTVVCYRDTVIEPKKVDVQEDPSSGLGALFG